MLRIAKIASFAIFVEVDKKLRELKVHYVSWNSLYDEVISLASLRVAEWQCDAEYSGAVQPSARKTLLNTNTVPACGSEKSVVRNSVGHASGNSGGELQNNRVAVPEVAYVFFFFFAAW